MVTSLICRGLFRVALPLLLLACVAFQQCCLSFLYLALLLFLPHVPAPVEKPTQGHTARFLKATIVICFFNVIAQIVFQIVLLSLQPYGEFLEYCTFLERVLRLVGLVRLDAIRWEDGVRWIAPEIILMVFSVLIWVMCSRMWRAPTPAPPPENPQQDPTQAPSCSSPGEVTTLTSPATEKGTTSGVLITAGKFLALASLGLAGVLRPSVVSCLYFLSFVGGSTWWACYKELRKAFGWVCRFCIVISALHIIALFVYQLPWLQHLVPPAGLWARLFGLTPLILIDCKDPRAIYFSDLEWASFLNPFALVWLYFVLTYTSPLFMKVPVKYDAEEIGKVAPNGQVVRSRFSRLSRNRLSHRPTFRWRSASRRAIHGDLNALHAERSSITSLETAPLLANGRGKPKYQAVGSTSGDAGLLQDSAGSLIWSRGESIASQDSIKMQVLDQHPEETLEEEEDDSGTLQLLFEALLSVIHLINKSAYIATNIIMMAWSITYHSWLTFVLLLWACILWMMPSQRRAMLRASPALVIYALFLLLAQYIYGMDLTDEELPQKIDTVNLSQIGFVKYVHLPCIPLIVKSLYTFMFWITLRQYMQEKWEEKDASAQEGLVHEPFNITVTTTDSGQQPISEISALQQQQQQQQALEQQPEQKGSPLMDKVGLWIKGLLTKFWIWVVAIMLFVIGLGGSEVVLYRIVYMALFLVFVLTFQLSYSAWRKMMYGFWVTVILYSMLILVLIYTYQFDNFPEYWKDYTKIPLELQHDIGLEVFDTGTLFIRLLTPTFFVIITVIQLHYFHKDFLAISDISKVPEECEETKVEEVEEVAVGDGDAKSGADPESGGGGDSNSKDLSKDVSKDISKEASCKPNLIDDFSFDNLKLYLKKHGQEFLGHFMAFMEELKEFVWRFLEVHMIKIVLLSTFLLAVYDISALHIVLAFIVIIALPCTTGVQNSIAHFCSVFASLLLITQMIYQINYIAAEDWEVNCTLHNASFENATEERIVNDAEWFGLRKTDNIPHLLQGYIGLILVMTLKAVVRIRQKYIRLVTGTPEPTPGIIYPGITRSDADLGLVPFIKFCFNYGFYKFGVEVCLLTTVGLIGARLDVFSVLYAFWLAAMFLLKRHTLAKIWIFYLVFILIILPIQYLICVGIPPGFCAMYPWDIDPELSYWLFLPDFFTALESYKLVTDFILLMFVCLQYQVFAIERRANAEYYPGGINEEVMIETIDRSENPVPDFITYTKNWLDVFKKITIIPLFWITVTVMFLAGTNRVNLFSIGYMVGSFVFLWKGSDYYLMPRRKILKWWNLLLIYNVCVIFIKTLLQLVGCVYLRHIQKDFCWVAQLFGIACLKKFSAYRSWEIAKEHEDCVVPYTEAGLMWDGICFGFLLLQRRLFYSYYFFHLMEDSKAQMLLASRGAELIEQVLRKQIKEQQEDERKVLEKIKQKMEKIKATHQKSQVSTRQPQSHYEGGSQMDPPSSGEQTPQGFHTPIEDYSDAEGIGMDGEGMGGGGAGLGVEGESDLRASLASQHHSPALLSSGNAPTPSSANLTLSLDGYLEQRLSIVASPQDTSLGTGGMGSGREGRQGSRRQRRRHRQRTLENYCSSSSSSSSSFPVFSPPPYETAQGMRRPSLGPPWLPLTTPRQSLSLSPAPSHHTSIRSGDYYMFEEYDDEELELLGDVEEEDNEEEREKTGGVTVSELLSSAMKTDMKHATKAAREKRKSEGESGHTDTTDSSAAHMVPARALSKDSEPPEKPPSGDPPKPGPSGEGTLADEPLEDEEEPVQESGPRKLLNLLRFAWELIESCLVSATIWLNKFSRDYRYVSSILADEKQQLKETGRVSHSPTPISPPPPPSMSGGGDSSSGLQKSRPMPKEPVEIRIEQASDDGGELDASSDIAIRSPTLTPDPQQGLSLDIVSSSGTKSAQDFSKDKHVLVQFVAAMWYVVVSHSDLVCYFVIFLDQIKSASVLSLPLPLLVFLWGTFSVPRPTKNFWVTVITYTEFIILMKWFFQFNFFAFNLPGIDPYDTAAIMGISKNKRYALYDLCVLIVVFFHRFVLKSLGLWKNSSPVEEELLSESLVTTDAPGSNPPSILSGPSGLMSTSTNQGSSASPTGCAPSYHKLQSSVKQQIGRMPDMKDVKKEKQTDVRAKRSASSVKMFFNQLLYPSYRKTTDVYAYMFMCDFFNFFVMIFGFSAFGAQQGDGGVGAYLEENKVPVPFLVMLIIQFALIIMDRALYLRKFIVGKFIFQLGLTVGLHLWMFFALPAITSKPFNSALPPQMWYMVKCFYLLLSAYQIRSGYPTRILGNFFCKAYNYINMFLFKAFMAVPFLFELRALMDWIWTDTSMTLPDWLKLEDIFASIFQLKCQRRVEKEYPQPRGEKKKPLIKYGVGGGFLFVIIAIIWFPLVLFALGNTVGQPNPPESVSVQLSIEGYQPLFTVTAQQTSLKRFSEYDYDQLSSSYSGQPVALTFLNDFDYRDVVVAQLNGNSTANWAISPPAQKRLVAEINSNTSTIILKLNVAIRRVSDNPSVPAEVIFEMPSIELKHDAKAMKTRKALAGLIEGSSELPVTINRIFPKVLQVYSTKKPKVVRQLTKDADSNYEYRNLNLNLQEGRFENTSSLTQWWEVREDCSDMDSVPPYLGWMKKFTDCRYLTLFTFNEKAFPSTLNFLSGGGIIGLYTTIVLVASKLVRGFFCGVAYTIMFDDMPNVDRILQLCLDIYLVRESRELALEEDLFAKLIFLYRSPETLIKWTRPKYEDDDAAAEAGQ